MRLQGRLDDQTIPAILDHIKKFGMIRGCCDGVNCSERTVRRAIQDSSKYYNADFDRQVQQALADYRACHTHPKDDPEIRRDILEQFKAMVKEGMCYEITFEYDDNGKLVKKKYHKAGVPQWVFECAFPPQSFTEQAILIVCGNQFDDLSRANVPEAVKSAVIQWLSGWMHRATEDLQKRGLSTKHLEFHHAAASDEKPTFKEIVTEITPRLYYEA